MNTLPTITCSANEITFLAAALGANTLLGVDDPFLGWLTEEIEEVWEETQTTLAKRNFIKPQSDGEIVMDVAVAAMIGTCAFPDASFVVTLTPAGGAATTHYLHVTEHLVVEQVAVTGREPAYRLTALADGEAAYRRVLEIFGLAEQPSVRVSGGELPEAALTQAREMIAQGAAAEVPEILREAGLAEDTAVALTETLNNPLVNGSLVALARLETAWDVAGLGILEGQNGLWRLRAFTRDGEQWVEVIPCDADAAREAVRRVMNRVLPERI